VHVVLRAANTNIRFDVRSLSVRIGRSPECDVQVPPELGASVSRTHAQISIHEGGVVVRDAGSRNGTFVNNVRLVAPHPATRGDQIMLGSGGPTFTIEELHIVKGQPTAPSVSAFPESATEAVTPLPTVRPPRRIYRPMSEPATAPSPKQKAPEPKPASTTGRKVAVVVGAVVVVGVLALLLFR
jgi:pSer/pThr/pTyr-binding forkhead associated (FHA) protein